MKYFWIIVFGIIILFNDKSEKCIEKYKIKNSINKYHNG